MPEVDDFNHAFDELLNDRFLLGSPAEVANQLIQLDRRLGVDHLVASILWPGMPNSLALQQLHRLAEEVRLLLSGTTSLMPAPTDGDPCATSSWPAFANRR
jgi:hypothetical protein